MPDLSRTAAPFNRIAHLMLNGHDAERLVPFQRGALSAQLKAPGGSAQNPTLNLTTPGLPQILQLIGVGGFLKDLEDVFKDLVTLNLPSLLGDAARLLPDLVGFVRQQLGLGLSLAALFAAASGGKDEITKDLHQAYVDYFFNDGFKTLEGGLISPPTAGTGASIDSVNGLAAEFRGLVSRKTGDQFLRDLIRVTGEAFGDAFFNVKKRYGKLIDRGFPDGEQCLRWFKGFANLAESTVTSAVEEATQGVGVFSTNPLIAAALATFAGVAARKATQAASLWEFGIDEKGNVTPR